MIYVGSRDGRKGLGLGLEMEETELEEGEALSYHDEVGDSTIDPDIDLSYIEEKLHKCLGHFQKDFEGGVSAENLGAKFGGYGSFLPSYQRSPSWSHTRSPADAHNYNSPGSPRKPHIEDQRQNSFASSSASPSARPRTASGKAVSVANSLKADGYLQAKNNGQSSLRNGVIKKSVNLSDQPTLKVRLKVGSESLSTQKNAEIYSGLGLVVSPSSSLDDSPTTSAGQCGKLLDVPEESPTSILQIMTSYPGELLLSPLSEDLIQLTEKRKHRGKRETKAVDKARIESGGTLVNGSLSSRSNQKDLEQNKLKLSEKDDAFGIDLTSQQYNSDKDNHASFLKKERDTDIDTLGCEELVSNALKLPLLSSSPNTKAIPAKDMSTAVIVPSNGLKDGVKGENFSVFTEKEYFDSESAHDIGRVEKSSGKQGSSGKVSESRKGNAVSNIAAYHQADIPKAEKSHASDQSESNASKGKKALSASEPTDPLKKLVVQKGGSVSEEGLKPAREKSSSGGKRKQKVPHGISAQGAHMGKDELMVESSLTPKAGKSSHTNSFVSKDDSHDLQKDHEKPGDRYKDFFGDVEFEDDDNESISGEMTSGGRLKDPQLVGKRSSSEDKYNGRSSEKPLPPEKHPRPASHLAPPVWDGPSSEAPTGMVPTVNEDWVSCDKCGKWRLLPLGTNPKSLPDKWLCRMLTWLPGMNRCSIPEDVTTNTLRALYHPAASLLAPASESQHVQLNSSIVTSVAMPSVDARYPAQEHQNIAVQTPAISGKKKHGSTKAANSTELDGSTHSSSLMKKKKNVVSGKISMDGRTNSPSLDACANQHMRQSSNAVEKYNDNKKERTSLVNSSEKGTNLKIRSKQEAEMEGSRPSKRVKSEELPFDDENWTSDNGATSSKAVRGSASLSNNTSGNDQRKYNDRKDVSGGVKKNVNSGMNAEIHVPVTSDNGSLRSGKGDDKDPVRKRKAKDHHGSQIHAEPVSSSGRHHLDSGDFMEEMSESEHRKEKKARVSKSGGNDTSGSKASVGTDRKSKSTKDQRNGQSLSNVQVTDYLKGDTGSLQPSVAANSSSSKVSGSHKNKTSGQEVKGSPVESVSSSPLRFSNADKVASNRKDLLGKDDFHESGTLAAVSPKRLSGVEAGGNDRTGMVKKDAILTVNNHVNDLYKPSSEQCKEEKTNMDQLQNSGFHSKKSGKGLSSHSKDKGRASGSDLNKVNMKASDSSHDSLNHVHYDEKSKSRRNKSDEKSGTPSDGISKKDTAGGTSNENSKGKNQKKFVHDGQDAVKSHDKKHNLQQERDYEKLPTKSNQAEVHGSGKSHSLPPLARGQTDLKENGGKSLAVNAPDNGDAAKAPNQKKKAESSNGQPIRHPTPNSRKIRDVEAPSPLRRDSSSHAANNALKEAKDLKHLADRLKNSGSADSIGFYFQAALKFLHGASLLEAGSSEATKHNELMHSMQIYSSTAKLCEFCAHEYEKSKDMAAAALAYKCMEVAYMRVVFSSHTSASRDRNELQAALQIGPPGESPSSSASDVDNLNHQATTEKAALAKVVGSPQVSGSHMITSRNRSGFLRILNFAQDVNFAMEASRKARMAFTAATSKLGESSHKEGISSLKKALDFNFQDVEGLLRLVRVAMEAISR